MPAVQCPRCGSGVADGLTECKICGASISTSSAPANPVATPPVQASGAPDSSGAILPGLGSAPAPAAPVTPSYLAPGTTISSGGGFGGEVKVSLTGEVVEIPPPTQRGAGPGGYGPKPGAPGAPGGPTARPGGPPAPPQRASRAGMPVQREQAPKSAAGPIFAVLFGLMILVGGGFGAYTWYNNRTNPKDQAQLVYKAIVKQDWKASYELIAWPDSAQKDANSESTFVTTAEAGSEMQKKILPPGLLDAMSAMEVTAGEPTVNGDKADVPTIGKMSFGGKDVTLKGVAHMKRQSGIWKLDMTQLKSASDAQGIQKSILDMMGKRDSGG